MIFRQRFALQIKFLQNRLSQRGYLGTWHQWFGGAFIVIGDVVLAIE